MKYKLNYRRWLVIILYLVALHSFLVGLMLIFMPMSVFSFFGFDIINRFFPSQGGVFHFVMCVAYILGVIWIDKCSGFIIFSITAKFIATVYLLTYYFFINDIWMVLLSGLVDFIMGIAILWLLIGFRKEKIINEQNS
jgi:hypothetical protein